MSTLTFYQNNAIEYAAETANVDFTATQERFLKYLPIGSHILDFGCGSGRDSKCFLERGYAVTATDGCKEFVALASSYTGLKLRSCFLMIWMLKTYMMACGPVPAFFICLRRS